MGKILDTLKINKAWLKSQLPFSTKLAHYPRSVASITKNVISGKGEINYLGHMFEYDNKFSPILLQNYPYEIQHDLLRYLAKPPATVLDIGANIGQFITTVSYYTNNKIVADVFEPNPSVIDQLTQNTKHIKNLRIYNMGVGEQGKTEMFYEPGRSAVGSFIKANAGTKQNLKKVSIDVVSDVAASTKRKNYDLVKIDVEGYEYEVIKQIEGIKMKYLFLEISTVQREKHYSHSELFRLIENKFGKYDILFSSALTKDQQMFNILVEFKK